MDQPFVINMKKPQNNSDDMADHHSFSNTSQKQDDLFLDQINYEMLNLCEIYDPEDEDNFSSHVRDAEMVAKNIVDKVINNGAEGMFNSYINEKIDGHIWEKIKNQLMNSQVQEFLDYDNKQDENLLDVEAEPYATYKDTWNRNQIETIAEPTGLLSTIPLKNWGIDPKMNASFTSQMTESKMYQSMVGRQKNEFTANKSILKQNKDNKQKEKEPKAAVPLPMSKKEIDIIEEQKRSFKEREIKQRLEKQEQENLRLAEVKEQQYRLNRINTEVKSKNFTFDYEGNIIMLQPLRIEKLPPTSYQLSYGIEDIKSQAQTKDKFKPGDHKANQEKQSKIGAKESQKQIVAQKQKKQPKIEENYTISPPIYETFMPTTGVTFIESGKVKTGPKSQISALNLLNYSQMTGSDPRSIRLSKNDYLNLIRQGNLSRQAQPTNFGKSQQQDLQDGSDIQKSKLLTASIQQEPLEESSYGVDQINIKGADYEQQLKQQERLKIQVSNTKLFDELLDASTQSNEPKQEKLLPLLSKGDTQQLNAYDQFNMNILRLKNEWGQGTQEQRFLPNLPSYKKPDDQSFSRTLQASTKKLPRARFRKQVVLDAGLDLQRPKHFPAPMIGQVMGHGFLSAKSMYSQHIDLSNISNQLLSTKNG